MTVCAERYRDPPPSSQVMFEIARKVVANLPLVRKLRKSNVSIQAITFAKCRCSLIGIEHETFNLGDTGSSPVTCTTPVWWNAYTLVSEASAERHGGSNPSTGTKSACGGHKCAPDERGFIFSVSAGKEADARNVKRRFGKACTIFVMETLLVKPAL